jgi:hypothetical protein
VLIGMALGMHVASVPLFVGLRKMAPRRKGAVAR